MNTFKCWLVSKIGSVLAFIIICILLMFSIFDDNINISFHPRAETLTHFIVVSIISFVLALIIAIFTWNNFDEIISRSTMWRNSKVALFDMKLTYSFTIFVESFVLFFILPYIFAAIFK